MDAAYVEQLGPAENVRYGGLPVPSPGPTGVLVSVQAVTVNPVDTFVRSGTALVQETVDTVIVTVEPCGWLVPPTGVCDSTVPAATVVSTWVT